MVNQFVGIILISILVEAVMHILFSVKALKQLDTRLEEVPLKLVFSMLLGIAFCYKVNIDILQVAFQTNASWFGYTITGIITSRGSNYVHDLVKKITDNTVK